MEDHTNSMDISNLEAIGYGWQDSMPLDIQKGPQGICLIPNDSAIKQKN
jgi:hypothetical protein